jgi:hypothetical protein
VRRRERVGRTSTVVEVVGEDPAALGEAVVSEDPTMVGGDPVAIAEADVEEERACSVVSAAVSEAPVVQAWRRLRSGCAGGGEIIIASVRV